MMYDDRESKLPPKGRMDRIEGDDAWMIVMTMIWLVDDGRVFASVSSQETTTNVLRGGK